MVFLGTPHHGAPLERGGHWIQNVLGASPYTAAFSRLAKLRSAGITDLRHGSLLDADWAGADRFANGRDTRVAVPLPDTIACHAVAGSLTREAPSLPEKALGDGLVPIASALGMHKQASRRLALGPDRKWIGWGLNHLDLMSSPAVFVQLRRWLVAPRLAERAPEPSSEEAVEGPDNRAGGPRSGANPHDRG
jgi:hypothetical protein